jgi:CBS-domain-containing membrane protein
VSIGLIATAAAVAHRPLLVPSLGPTAFLIFERPRLAAAAPRNIVVGHLLAIGVGEMALFVTGTGGATTISQLTPSRAAAATLAVALVMIVMVLISVPHPPAAATALIVSLGVVSGPRQLAALVAAVVLLALQGLVIDRLAGLRYPVWRPEGDGPMATLAHREDVSPSHRTTPTPPRSARPFGRWVARETCDDAQEGTK